MPSYMCSRRSTRRSGLVARVRWILLVLTPHKVAEQVVLLFGKAKPVHQQGTLSVVYMKNVHVIYMYTQELKVQNMVF